MVAFVRRLPVFAAGRVLNNALDLVALHMGVIVADHTQLAHVLWIEIHVGLSFAHSICNDSILVFLLGVGRVESRTRVLGLLLTHADIFIALNHEVISCGSEVNETLLVFLDQRLGIWH
mgnify:CR=1 FL=1